MRHYIRQAGALPWLYPLIMGPTRTQELENPLNARGILPHCIPVCMTL
ncbi:unnamed protein product [Chondrus crispus]|uniref:Uncharacterized protein n=1 Tax=Chondrus crispus TaxID=2769 RepID=R7QGS7_CHOCR|nr:unnamed protein product [Chondrus crispus]CDF36666.1 unnamed protein product [Chondrus crispus]|eukprot:XP_005716485.1 unnamed protein product [Chondrus crispus]